MLYIHVCMIYMYNNLNVYIKILCILNIDKNY